MRETSGCCSEANLVCDSGDLSVDGREGGQRKGRTLEGGTRVPVAWKKAVPHQHDEAPEHL